MISLDDVFSGKVKLPRGLKFCKAKAGDHDYIDWVDYDDSVTPNEDVINEFAKSVKSDDLKCFGFPKGYKVGNYLVHENKIGMLVVPGWIDKSIIRLTDIWPLKQYASGVGVRDEHPCAYHQTGWIVENLFSEVLYMESWKAMDEEGLLKYTEEKNIKLV